MTEQDPPLLESFFRGGRGTVFYKAYPPFRGDDVQATLELAATLPRDVKFVPVLPELPHVFDSRVVMANVLSLVENSDSILHEIDEVDVEALRQLTQLVEGSVPQDRRSDADKLLRKIYEEHPTLGCALETMIPYRMYTDKYDPSRFSSLVPDEGPVLVVGRPSLFRNDLEVDHPRSLQNVLRSAGFPNRFDFVQPLGDVMQETLMIRDRRKHVIYTREYRKPSLTGERASRSAVPDDVGFIFSGFSDSRQPLIVACGTTSFGTYSAVQLLMQDRPVIRQHCATQKKSKESMAIDLAFRCKQISELSWRDPMIEIINPRNATGFRWTQAAVTRFSSLLEWWSSQEELQTKIEFDGRSPKKSGLMTWQWERPDDLKERQDCQLVKVRISACAYISGKHRLIRGATFEGVLRKIREHLKQDLHAWWRRRHEPATFRPILMVGETGTGKSIIAEVIANCWQGKTLQDKRRSLQDTNFESTIHPGNRERLLKHADDQLEESTKSWPIRVLRRDQSNMLTFSSVAVPPTMLDRELFGVVAGYVQGCAPAAGVFVLAGTGVLFLDELLELPKGEQKRLLLVLQKGVVRPLGAERDYRFVCRLVAATNLARNIEELNDRIHRGKLRRDLIARFSHRYELPPLRTRVDEIVPLLITLIETRVRRDFDERDAQIRILRMSRPAFEALISFDFHENVRDLEHFVDELTPSVVRQIWDLNNPNQNSTGEIAKTAIRLKDLELLLIGRMDDEASTEGASRVDEDRYYEFHLELKEEPFDEWVSFPVSENLKEEFQEILDTAFGDSGLLARIVQGYRLVKRRDEDFLGRLKNDTEFRAAIEGFRDKLLPYMKTVQSKGMRAAARKLVRHDDVRRIAPLRLLKFEIGEQPEPTDKASDQNRPPPFRIDKQKLAEFKSLMGLQTVEAEFLLSVLSGENFVD